MVIPPPSETEELANVPEWDADEKLERERAVLGLYLSDHPLAQYRVLVDRYEVHGLATIPDLMASEL